MPYSIYRSDGTPVTVADGFIDTQFYNPAGGGGVVYPSNGLGIQLIGQNTIGYGAAIAQTFLQMTENFCSSGLPPSDVTALQGQLWFQQVSNTSGNLYVRVTSNGVPGGIINWRQLVTGTNGIASSATNLSGGAPGSIPYQTGPGITAQLPLGTTGWVLTAGATTPTYINPSTLSVGSAASALNIAGALANEIPYQTAPGVTSFITAPTLASTFLEWNGSAFVWTASGGGGVQQIIAGTNVTISPTSGVGVVTINAAGGGGGAPPSLVVEVSTGSVAYPVGMNPNNPSAGLLWNPAQTTIIQTSTESHWDYTQTGHPEGVIVFDYATLSQWKITVITQITNQTTGNNPPLMPNGLGMQYGNGGYGALDVSPSYSYSAFFGYQSGTYRATPQLLWWSDTFESTNSSTVEQAIAVYPYMLIQGPSSQWPTNITATSKIIVTRITP